MSFYCILILLNYSWLTLRLCVAFVSRNFGWPNFGCSCKPIKSGCSCLHPSNAWSLAQPKRGVSRSRRVRLCRFDLFHCVRISANVTVPLHLRRPDTVTGRWLSVANESICLRRTFGSLTVSKSTTSSQDSSPIRTDTFAHPLVCSGTGSSLLRRHPQSVCQT